MQELYVRNKFLISPLERHFKTFQGFSSLLAFYVSIHIALQIQSMISFPMNRPKQKPLCRFPNKEVYFQSIQLNNFAKNSFNAWKTAEHDVQP